MLHFIGRAASAATLLCTHSLTRLYLLDMHRADHLFMYSFPPLRRLLSRP
jgi:hypothetical protein